MGLRAAWKTLFSRDNDAASSAGGLLAGITAWNQAPTRGTKEVQQGYVSVPYLHSIARRIAEEVASVPFQVLSVPRARRKSFVQARGVVGAAIRRKAIAKGEMQPLESHPFLDVLSTFNPALPAFESRMVAQLYADLNGQVPLVRENDGIGRCVELWPIPPQWVAEMPRPDQPAYRVAHASWFRLIPEDAMVWGRVADPINPYGRGTSFGRALADSLDIIESRDRFIATFFRNDATPAGILTIQGANEAVALRKKEEWNARFKGPENAGKIDVTTGATSFTALTPTPQQLQIAESRGEARSIIQEVLWVPPEILGVVENSNRSTIDAAYYIFARGVLVPRLERWVSWLQPLLEEYGDALVLGYENPVPEDDESQRAHMVAVPSAFRVNEHRRAGGEPPLPGAEGDELFSPPAAAPASLRSRGARRWGPAVGEVARPAASGEVGCRHVRRAGGAPPRAALGGSGARPGRGVSEVGRAGSGGPRRLRLLRHEEPARSAGAGEGRRANPGHQLHHGRGPARDVAGGRQRGRGHPRTHRPGGRRLHPRRALPLRAHRPHRDGGAEQRGEPLRVAPVGSRGGEGVARYRRRA
jgi:hypothetical protein